MHDPLKEQIINLIQSPGYKPLTKSEIARKLEISSKNRSQLRELLSLLEKEGRLIRGKKGRYTLRKNTSSLFLGTVLFHPNGSLFFQPDTDESQDNHPKRGMESSAKIAVASFYADKLLPEDRVLVRLQKKRPPKWHRYAKKKQTNSWKQEAYEAHIHRVLKRKNTILVGTYDQRNGFAYLIPDDSRISHTIAITDCKRKLQPKRNDKVLVDIEEEGTSLSPLRGSVIKILGNRDTPFIDILSLVYQYQLPTEFPQSVLEEAQAISPSLSEEEFSNREDWRRRLVITIDPTDAKDFDDAIHVSRTKKGWLLAVHVADVSHYVKPNSAIDLEAQKRGNSVYLVDRVIPMLPEELSNALCSLLPQKDRLTRTVIMEFDKRGRLEKHSFASSIIRSHARLTYEETYHFMSTSLPSPAQAVPEMLHQAWELASLLRKHRIDQGTLDLDLPEIKVILDKQGKTIELRKIEHDAAHQLIEEFMLVTNEVVARTIKKSKHPTLYRVHEDPQTDKLFELQNWLHSFGFHVEDLSHRKEMQKLLTSIKGKPEEQVVSLAILKSLTRAHYHTHPLGHYGLAKSDYTHFTSPIRRYADLVVHRVLEKILSPHSPIKTPTLPILSEIADHLSTMERHAASAEMESKKLKELEYFVYLKNKNHSLKGVICEFWRNGILVYITDYFVKGLVPFDQLPSRYHYLDIDKRCLYGEKPKKIYRLGDSLSLHVLHVDLEKKQVDFTL